MRDYFIFRNTQFRNIELIQLTSLLIGTTYIINYMGNILTI